MLISFAADLISRCLNSVYSVRGDEGRRREEKGEEERKGEDRRGDSAPYAFAILNG